jgi:hypothetical protein
MDAARQRRKTSATVMNQESSRSHMIICIKMISDLRTSYCSESSFMSKDIKYSKINIVDLAGSESVGKMHGGGTEDFKTGIQINKSLLALRSTLADLVENCGKPAKGRKHINFRDSKLTQILKDSLGGNCLTSFIGMVTPTLVYSKESRITMELVSSCKKISVLARQNTVDTKKAAKLRLYGTSKPVITRTEAQQKKAKKIEMPWKNIGWAPEFVMVETKYGKVCVMDQGEQGKPVIVLLHAAYCDATTYSHWVPA